MRERSKSYAYICAHWQPLSPQEHRNCYKGVTMESQEQVESQENPEILIQSPTSPGIIEMGVEPQNQEEQLPIEDNLPEPEESALEPEQGEKEIAVDNFEPESQEEEEDLPQDPPEEIPLPPPAAVDIAEIETRLEEESPLATDLPSVENISASPLENSEVFSPEMVEAVSNFQMISPSQEKEFEINHNKEHNSYHSPPVESSPEPITSPQVQDEADNELESELIVHDEGPTQEDPIEETQQEEKVASPVQEPEPLIEIETPIAPKSITPEPPKEEKKIEKPKAAQPTGMKTPTARAAPKLQAAKTPVTAPPKPAAAAAPKRPVPAVSKPAAAPKPSPMSRPPPPRSTPSAPRPAAPRSQSQHRTPVSRNGSTNRLESLPNTPKLVNKKYQNVTSKIGSITDHKPTGGNIEIFSEKKKYNVTSKIGSLEKADHKPGGGNVKIETQKLVFKDTAKSRVDAASSHTPKGGNVKIPTQKLNWNVQSKIGSLDNASHKAGGGQVKILNQKLEWNAESKVGSKDNIQHKPGGGNVQIYDDKLQYVAQPRIGSTENADHVSGSVDAYRTDSNKAKAKTKPGKMPGAVDPLTAEQILS